MQLLSFLGVAAAFASVTAAQEDLPPHSDLKYDETADWYKDHGKPVPDPASEVTVVEEYKSYIVKLDCPGCPFLVEEGRNASLQERDNSLLLKIDLQHAVDAFSTLSLNGARILPLDPMPLFINAYQVAANLSQEAMDSIVREGVLETDFASQTKYHKFPLHYEHTLLKTNIPGQWLIQFDVTNLQYGPDVMPVYYGQSHKLVEILVKEQRDVQHVGGSLFVEDIRTVAQPQRTQPIRMKCGKLAVVKTSFHANEWDEYGKLGSWSRVWNMVFGKIGQYWLDNALLMPLVLLLAFVVFFARVWHQRRQQDKAMDAEYALLETSNDDLPPTYSDIPIIKIEEYD